MSKSHFDQLHIAAGGTIRNAITGGRVLTAMFGNLFFVISHDDNDQAARAVADELDDRHEGFRSVFVILFTDAHLDALAADVTLNLAVLVAGRGHHLARFGGQIDYGIADSAIVATNKSQVELVTEYGDFVSEVVTTSELHAGDIYTCGVPRLGSGNPGLAVYRAKSDYDPTAGEVRHHLVEPGQTPPPDEKRTGALTDGPDQLVHRVVDRAAFLETVGLTDLVPA